MMIAVADSGPFLHLAVVNQTALLPRYFHPLFIPPQVYDEVVTQGRGRAGSSELAAACTDGSVRIVELADQHLIDQVRHVPSGVSDVSDVDVRVIALAIEQHALVLSDDGSLRLLAMAHGVPVIGSVGICVWARLDGVIPALKPLLDQLIASGFHLDPHGRVYQDALRKVGES
jgi:predicted nucleic acid-binding protein